MAYRVLVIALEMHLDYISWQILKTQSTHFSASGKRSIFWRKWWRGRWRSTCFENAHKKWEISDNFTQKPWNMPRLSVSYQIVENLLTRCGLNRALCHKSYLYCHERILTLEIKVWKPSKCMKKIEPMKKVLTYSLLKEYIARLGGEVVGAWHQNLILWRQKADR